MGFKKSQFLIFFKIKNVKPYGKVSDDIFADATVYANYKL